MTKFYTNISQIGNHIFTRGFDENGQRFAHRELYEPYLFISSQRETGLTDIHGQTVEQKNFEKISDARAFIDMYKDVAGIKIYGFDRWPYVHIYDTFKDIEPDTSKINVIGIDIEVISDDGSFPQPEAADHPIVSIAMRRRDLKIVLGLGEYQSSDKNTYYIQCKNEYELLLKFLESWEKLDVDVLTGWNTEFFDIPYLIHRITRVLGEDAVNRLSPWKKIHAYTVSYGSKKLTSYNIIGIACLDYLAVYKKFRLQPRESYRLDYIAELELGEKKVDYSEEGDLRDLYRLNFQKFIDYNIQDTDLILRLEEKLGYLNQIFAIAYDAGTNFNDALSTLTNWDSIIHRYLRDQNTVIPLQRSPMTSHHIEGGYVKPPYTGMHEWVMSFDLNSLYPSLIQGYNISPDTWVKNLPELYETRMRSNVNHLFDRKIDTSLLKEYDVSMTANGNLFSRDKRGFLPQLMADMYEKRVYYKNKFFEAKLQHQENPTPELERDISRFHNMQHALKILLNSAYGALASKYFRWFELEHAEAITMSGQLAIRWVERDINAYLNKILMTENQDFVLAIDTDSVYVCFDALVKHVFKDTSNTNDVINFLDKVAKTKIEPVIDKSYQDLADYMNAFEQKMVMKRENIANKAIWTAKKRYIMNVYDSEGVRYETPDLKMMGIEAIRSSTPGVCREYIKQTLEIIMSKNEKAVQDFIKTVREEFYTLSFDDIAFPRGITMTTTKTSSTGSTYNDTYACDQHIYKKGTPIQVKGALLYNHYIDKYNLDRKYEKISDGEKIKFCYLKVPNPIKEKVISCPGRLPPELNLDKFLDYDMQFEKGYLSPISSILEAIGWHAEKKSTLEDFFI